MEILNAYEKKCNHFASCQANASSLDSSAGGEELRFQHLDDGLRDVLLCQWPSWIKLEKFEEELVDYFASKPSGIWKTVIKDSFDRLMLRAVSQWLFLQCLSFFDRRGKRRTCVRNSKEVFRAPRERLSAFVRRKRGLS
uniref:Uncharacterized protein n=1 Tax=Trichuris muris TaxID=70415 RepID=A0A5S6Q5I0_TRIMR